MSGLRTLATIEEEQAAFRRSDHAFKPGLAKASMIATLKREGKLR